ERLELHTRLDRRTGCNEQRVHVADGVVVSMGADDVDALRSTHRDRPARIGGQNDGRRGSQVTAVPTLRNIFRSKRMQVWPCLAQALVYILFLTGLRPEIEPLDELTGQIQGLGKGRCDACSSQRHLPSIALDMQVLCCLSFMQAMTCI